ncbi:MAG: transporter substrate-binding domain-containing protein, partial [Chloroflexi bacterium]|nr:transporter substrate-binding domain-containing protein [Chloroflexota bacterium]
MKTLRGIFLLSLILLFVTAVIGCGGSGDIMVEEDLPTDASLNDVKAKGTLVVGVDIPYGVMEFYDESGNATGIDMDIARGISSQLNVTLEIKTMPFADLFGALKGGEIDVVISAVTITPERQETMLFSAPYLDAGMSIAVKNDNTDINSLKDLDGKRIGVLKGTI